MELPSHELKAFAETARTQNMTVAARNLLITQSALSQRIQKLESLLECTLFIRDRAGIKVTEAGLSLLRYTQSVDSIEEEFLYNLKSSRNEIAGNIRIAAYSSILRSLIIPALASFLRKNPKVHCEFQSYEVAELPRVLDHGEADFVISDYRMNKSHLVETLLGHEEYVVIESSKHKSPETVYLDHGPHDNATESYFASQKNAPKFYKRSFMGDVYGILDGVEEGLGRAVMSKHLLDGRKNIVVVSGYKAYSREIVLHHFKRDYLPRLYLAVLKELSEKLPRSRKS